MSDKIERDDLRRQLEQLQTDASNRIRHLEDDNEMMLKSGTAILRENERLKAELAERRKAMADIVRALGEGCGGLAHNEIAPRIADLRRQLTVVKYEKSLLHSGSNPVFGR